MAKKPVPRPVSGGSGIKRLKEWYGRHKKDPWLPILLVFLLALTPLAYRQIQIYRERRNYDIAHNNISMFADSVSKLAKSTVDMGDGCSHSSAKFEAGTLGCFMYAMIEYEPTDMISTSAVMARADEVQQELGWHYLRNNIWNPTSSSDKVELSNRLYEFGDLSCGVEYEYRIDHTKEVANTDSEKRLVITIRCSGPALKEYY